MVQPHRQALIEIPGGRMKRRVQRATMAAEDVTRLLGDAAIDVDRFEAALWRQGQRQFRRTNTNHAQLCLPPMALAYVGETCAISARAVNWSGKWPRKARTRSITSPTTLSGVEAPAVIPMQTSPSASQPGVRVS